MKHNHRAHRRRRRGRHSKPQQRGTAFISAALILLVGVIAVLGVSLALPGPGKGQGAEVLVEVAEGSTLSEIAPELENKGIVDSASEFLTAASLNIKSHEVYPGFYRLREGMGAEAAVDVLTNPDNKIDMLNVNPGMTLMDLHLTNGDVRFGIYTQISQVACSVTGNDGCVTAADLERVAATVDPAELGAPEWALEPIRARGDDPKRLEGLISPGQYVVNPGMSAQEILTDLLTRSTKVYNDTGIVDRAKAINLTPYELLTAASIVEREAPAGEFDKVARVILNRLELPMRLQMDSTVNYDLETVETATTDADRERVTPWNTYASDGLPQTPIASPSEEAIRAMENPAEGDWLYFVTVDKDGTTIFNSSLEAHNEAQQQAFDSGVLDSNR
ncbi:endolytic transglycosylase MltG [Corynebacterium uterequi]|uniref:Endolytic murein transglycosylase n=1 Tax=Corynebacterium uterequi TaxID=1072256 RepID=A0A0G3HER3_9CORY|nr:endolytic transglycosylase MltG [Corynebacterium uterequi]AKK11210.1 YceG family protein [Corynebacterium uterequi]